MFSTIRSKPLVNLFSSIYEYLVHPYYNGTTYLFDVVFFLSSKKANVLWSLAIRQFIKKKFCGNNATSAAYMVTYTFLKSLQIHFSYKLIERWKMSYRFFRIQILLHIAGFFFSKAYDPFIVENIEVNEHICIQDYEVKIIFRE